MILIISENNQNEQNTITKNMNETYGCAQHALVNIMCVCLEKLKRYYLRMPAHLMTLSGKINLWGHL